MIRLLSFIVIVFAIGLGFTWLADRPGEMVVTFAGYEYRVTLMVAAVGVVAIVVIVMLLWWVLKGLWNSPYTVSRYFRVRRRDRGYQALSTGLIAAGSGDASRARHMRKQAVKLISSDQEPLVHLLDAQTAMLEGDHDGARKKFEAMLDDPEMRLLGLRGLYLEAERQGDHVAARHFAGRAAAAAPQLGWASDATLDEKVEQGDWEGALKLVDAQKSTKLIDRETLNRRKAVLLTGKATALFETSFDEAKAAAIEANRLEPEFVPAAVIAAKAYFRGDDLKRGARILEHAWKRNPHPEIASTYVFARHGNSTTDRLARAQKLASLRTNNAESALAVARAALDARDFVLAREQAETALRLDPREGVYLLLADIEEADTRNQGRIRQYLARALRAPRDHAWVADGYVSQRWAPASPLTGRLDAFEWKAPSDRVAEVIDQLGPEPEAEPLNGVAPSLPPAVTEAKRDDPEKAAGPTAVLVNASNNDADRDTPSEDDPRVDHPKPGLVSEPASPAPKIAVIQSPDRGIHRSTPNPDAMVRPPDDPGVDEAGRQTESAAKFRLF